MEMLFYLLCWYVIYFKTNLFLKLTEYLSQCHFLIFKDNYWMKTRKTQDILNPIYGLLYFWRNYHLLYFFQVKRTFVKNMASYLKPNNESEVYLIFRIITLLHQEKTETSIVSVSGIIEWQDLVILLELPKIIIS